MPEDDHCDLTVPMEEWIGEYEGGDDEFCRPCTLGLLVNWYVEELREHGKDDLANLIESVKERVDVQPMSIAVLCDDIKGSVDESLRLRLREFDCTVQVLSEKDINLEERR